MTIHHDKLAYGKIASSHEDISEEKLKKMLELLNGNSPEDMPKGTDKTDGEKAGDTNETTKDQESEDD